MYKIDYSIIAGEKFEPYPQNRSLYKEFMKLYMKVARGLRFQKITGYKMNSTNEGRSSEIQYGRHGLLCITYIKCILAYPSYIITGDIQNALH